MRSGLRAKQVRWPPVYEVLNAAKRNYTGPNKRQKFEYQCAICGNWFMRKDVQVDHKIPTGSLKSYEDLPGFVERLFVGVEGLQVLCTNTCHAAKTAQEREDRKHANLQD